MTFIILFLSTLTTFAFNQDHCGDLFPKNEDRHPPYFSVLYTLTMVPSTTSYVSSFGKCSMYGNRELRERYIAYHYPTLSREASQGSGEYVELLRELTGCPTSNGAEFRKLIQSNFESLFPDPQTPEKDFSQKLDGLLKNNEQLSRNCKVVAS